jgi:hypothetical protein
MTSLASVDAIQPPTWFTAALGTGDVYCVL